MTRGVKNQPSAEAPKGEATPTPQNEPANQAASGAVRQLDVQDLDSAKQGTAKIVGDNVLQTEDSDIEINRDVYGLSEKAKTLAFFEELVTINIHESTDENAEPMVYIAVNGEGPGPLKTPWVPRGQDITIKRKFVERLLRARHVSYKSKERVNQENGEREVVYPSSAALKYPFTIVEDRNPRGRDWLKAVMREGA